MIRPMFEEGTPLQALWQCIVSAHMKWMVEIEERLDVTIDARQSGFGHVFAPEISGPGAWAARHEVDKVADHIVDLYDSLRILRGDPITSRMMYRAAADLYGRTHWDAIVESGNQHIEAVLIGPAHRAAEMLASEPRLLAAARYRVLHSHDLDSFTPHVQQLVAHADSILAAKAFDGVMNGRI